jgi:hypothetical protein
MLGRRHPAFGLTLLVVSVVVLVYDGLSNAHSLNSLQVVVLVVLAIVGAVLVGLDLRSRRV